MSVQQFTAVSDCPSCGSIAVHWLDEPQRATPKQWADYEAAKENYDPFDATHVIAWGGDTVQTRPCVPFPKPPRDEDWPVTRVCTKCGHRWGQR